MSKIRKSMMAALMGAMLAGAAALLVGGFRACAAPVPPPGPMKIAVVNIIKLSDKLAEKISRTKKMQAMLDSFKTNVAEKQKLLKKMGEPLNPQSTLALKPGTPAYQAQQDKLVKATIADRIYIAYMQAKIRSEHTLLIAKLYHDITIAVKAYAKQHGIALVLQKEPMNYSVANDKTLMTEIRSRKVLYASDTINITDRLLKIMNRQWKKTHGQ